MARLDRAVSREQQTLSPPPLSLLDDIVMYVDAGRLVEMLGPIQTIARPSRRVIE